MNHCLAHVTMLATWLLGTEGWDGDTHHVQQMDVKKGGKSWVASLWLSSLLAMSSCSGM